MGCDYIDLYMLHWPGSVPLEQTFAALNELLDAGKIRDFGVSNFNLGDLEKIPPEDQARLGCNQVFYNLAHREVEWEVADWCRQRGTPIMAYSPLDQASKLLHDPAVNSIAGKHGATPAQVALAWLLQQPETVVIPKTSQVSRLQENLGALELALDEEDLAKLDVAFPPPSQPVRLGMR